MKELSIEEKAKRYDETLGKARQLCVYPTSKPFISDLQDLFPELKESEGEKIRKQIISFLKEFEYDHYRSLDFSSWIAWLEKQGEQKSTWKPSDKQMDALNLAIGEANAVDTAAGDEAAEILTFLYEQLKKLRKE